MTFGVYATRQIIAGMSVLLSLPVSAQSLAGKWVSTGRPLDNGERNISILELKQDGSNLTGTMSTLGYTTDVKGTASGAHFQIFASWDPGRPFLEGELAGDQLQGRLERRPYTAHHALPGEELPAIPVLPLPAVQPVPSNGLAKTPPMGWNSWNLFAGRIDDQTVRGIADAMVSSGMRDAGYVYVNIDDTWEGTRDASGTLQANHKFPDMKALADYVHSKGLKLGIYSSPGPRTCASYPGSYGHEEQDAKTFAAWGIDYLKYDWCSAGKLYRDDALQPLYDKMGLALSATGRPIVYSLCEYGNGAVQTWGTQVGANLWRTTGDIRDEWSSMLANIEKQVPTAPYAGPGHWNDPDMLEIGNGHMTNDEYRTHMSLWALTAAPLLAGNDIRNMSQETRAILLNKEVIAVDQDTLGKQASPVKKGDMELWAKPLADGSVAVALVNLSAQAAPGTITPQDTQLSGQVTARDLWLHKDVLTKGGSYTATIPPHGVLLLRVRKAAS
jgi:alpha-galactosidase